MISTGTLIEDLKRVAQAHGNPTYDSYRYYGQHCCETLMKRFGTWNAALFAAGLPLNKIGRKSKLK